MNKRIHIKWESNSRAKRLVADGVIKNEDIIPRTTTDKFPAEAATVRMQRLSQKIPLVTVHIRGKSKVRNNWNNTFQYECASTLRVNMYPDYADAPSGELDEDYSWLDVHNVVTEVKEAMELK